MDVSTLVSQLEDRLGAFTGRNYDVLGAIVDDYTGRADFRAALVELALRDDPEDQYAAVWLATVDMARSTPVCWDVFDALMAHLDRFEDTRVIGFLLRSMRHLKAPREDAEHLASFALRFLDHDKPFVFGAALIAISQIALYHPEYRPIAAAARERANHHPKKIVRLHAKRVPNFTLGGSDTKH